MQKPSDQSLYIAATLLLTAAIITSIRFIDTEVAVAIWSFTPSQPLLHKHFAAIPDTLPKVVVIATATMWLAYFSRVRNKVADTQAQFLRLAACAVPAAYMIKIFLQWGFGRTHIRWWLRGGGPIEFRWFYPQEYGGFPSGHMVVFTAFFSAVWLYYPRQRPLVVSATSGLALLLLLTSYHFVSDILAGIGCGILITVGMDRLISKKLPTQP